MSEVTYAHRIAAHQVRDRDATALRYRDRDMSYGELMDRVHGLSTFLAQRILRGEPVGLRTPRGPATAVGMLGITLAGGVIVPMVPEEPPHRLEFIVRDCGARLAVCAEPGPSAPPGLEAVRLDESGRPRERSGARPAPVELSAADAAYMIYTSGSTGSPKGVLVEHRSLSTYLDWCATVLLDPGLPMPAVSSPAFDASLKQLLGPLVMGSTAWLVDDATATDPRALAGLVARSGPCALNCVPSLWHAILAELEWTDQDRLDLRRLFLGGEPASRALLDRTRALLPGAWIWNLYGPTEATANATGGVLVEDRPPTLGDPVAGTEVGVLDDRLEPVGAGETGELYIRGAGVARGYHGRPALTAGRFVPDPFAGRPGARMFRTGDLVTRAHDGALEFRGRRDRMIKRYGVRVELGEVEHALRCVDGVLDAAVLLDRSRSAAGALTAVVEVPGGDVSPADVRLGSAGRLPRVAIPDVVHVVPRLPRTSGGKVDLAAVREFDATRPVVRTPDTPPLDELVAAIWSQVLETHTVALHDDFFELGGHSLAMLRIAGRVGELLDVELPVDVFYEATTVAQHAELLRGAGGAGADLDERARRALLLQRPADGALVGPGDGGADR